MGFKFEVPRSAFAKAFEAQRDIIARASQAAVSEVGLKAKEQGRANIARAGFSERWQKALRLDVYPSGGRSSISAAAVLQHRVSYSGVFEQPTEIEGKPFLWIPLTSAAERFPAGFNVSGKATKRLTPKSVAGAGYKLKTFVRPGKAPILAGRFPITGRGRSRARFEWVPLFVGVKTASMKTGFDIIGAARDAAKGLPAAFAKYLQKDI